MSNIIFVCWGNICRSPMAERVAESFFAKAGLSVDVTSAAVSGDELGSPIDSRAAKVLAANGYRTGGHVAHRITQSEIEQADLVIAAEPMHIEMMRRLAPDAKNLHLVNDFNEALPKGTALQDPWYGDASGFHDTLADIEAAMPAIVQLAQGLGAAPTTMKP